MSNSLSFYEEAVVNARRAKAKAKADLKQITKQCYAQADIIKQTWQDIKHYQDNLVSSEPQQDADYIELWGMQDRLRFRIDQYKKLIRKSNREQEKLRSRAESQLQAGRQAEANLSLKQADQAKRKSMSLTNKQNKLKAQKKAMEAKITAKQCQVFPELSTKIAVHEEAKQTQDTLRISQRRAKKHLKDCQERLNLAQERYIKAQKASKATAERNTSKKVRICCYRCRKIIFVSGNEKYCPDCKAFFAFSNQSR